MSTPSPQKKPVSGLAGKTFRPDIQGLRAIAVLLVLVFHIWPSVLPGGYVGVDVFFVISGYLITGILVRQATGDGRIGFLAFYARRARRLLPAATVVLLAVVAASFWLMPSIHWHETAQDTIAASIYMTNWWLAVSAGDYFASDAAASPLQHYWSLAIEEQFYVLWPAFVAAVVALARRLKLDTLRALATAMAVIFVLSLARSYMVTHDDRAWAYFATTTRAWELALGGVLAIAAPRVNGRWGALLGSAGLVAIIMAALSFDGSSVFPGWIALLPVLGTAAVIYSGAATAGSSPVDRLLGGAISQYLGGISYSLYLWHWPLIVFAAYITGSPPGLYDGLALILGSVILADLSKRFVEDPIYKAPQREASVRRGFQIGATCVVAAAGAGLALLLLPGIGTLSADVAAGDESYPGAAVMSTEYVHDHVPALTRVRGDVLQDYKRCHGNPSATEIRPCPSIGPADATVDIAVVGDSHAGQWTPALFELADRAGVKIHIFTKSACPFTLVDIRDDGEVYEECSRWNRNLVEVLRSMKPEIVFSSASSASRARDDQGRENAQAIAAGQQALWRELRGMGTEVVLMRDTPRPARVRMDPAECLARAHTRPADCSVVRSKVVAPETEDPNLLSARAAPYTHLVDLTDHICNAAACDPIVGNVIVWRDNNHITATYAKTLAPVLERALGPVLARAGAGRRDPTPAEPEPESGVTVEGLLECGPTGRHPPFERAIDVLVSKDRLEVRRGDEVWRGEISPGGQITVTGTYREGGPDVKEIEFSGHRTGARVELQGRRGPRNCVFAAPVQKGLR